MTTIKSNKTNLERLFKELEEIAKTEKYEDFFVSKMLEYMDSLFYNKTSKQYVIGLYQENKIFNELLEMLSFWPFYSEEEAKQIKKLGPKTTNIWKGRNIKKDFFTLQKIHYKVMEQLDNGTTLENSDTPKPLEQSQSAIFAYNINTGDGRFKEKEFRLSEGTNYRKIFDACYQIKGQKLERPKVAAILGLNNAHGNDGVDMAEVLSAFNDTKTRKKSVAEVKITAAINREIKILRNKIGLNTKQLVNNGGNITLVV